MATDNETSYELIETQLTDVGILKKNEGEGSETSACNSMDETDSNEITNNTEAGTNGDSKVDSSPEEMLPTGTQNEDKSRQNTKISLNMSSSSITSSLAPTKIVNNIDSTPFRKPLEISSAKCELNSTSRESAPCPVVENNVCDKESKGVFENKSDKCSPSKQNKNDDKTSTTSDESLIDLGSSDKSESTIEISDNDNTTTINPEEMFSGFGSSDCDLAELQTLTNDVEKITTSEELETKDIKLEDIFVMSSNEVSVDTEKQDEVFITIDAEPETIEEEDVETLEISELNLDVLEQKPLTGRRRARKDKQSTLRNIVESISIDDTSNSKSELISESESSVSNDVNVDYIEPKGIKPRRRGRTKKNPEIIPSHLSSELIYGYKILLKFFEIPHFKDFYSTFELNTVESPDKKVTCLSQIKDKFENNLYKEMPEFVNDVQEMLFYIYEAKDTRATKKALRLEQLLDQRIAQLPTYLRQQCARELSTDESSTGSKKTRINKGGGYVSFLLEKAEKSRTEKDKEKRRLLAEERKQLKEEQDKDVQEWEKSVLLGEHENEIRAMWELPQIGHFVHLCREMLNIGEIPQYEIERMLLVPQCSSTLDLLVTALLSNSLVRAKLDRTPPMPYSIWAPLVRTRVTAWYRSWHRENKNSLKLFEEIGIEPLFWEVLGPEINLLDYFWFHELTFVQRVWVLKTLCDVDFIRKKTVYDNIRVQPLDELNGLNLGIDRHGYRYIHFKQFCGPDLRIYRQKAQIEEGFHYEDLIESTEGFENREGPITMDKIFKDIWDVGDKFEKLDPPIKRRKLKKKRVTRVNMKEEELLPPPRKNLRQSARSKRKKYVDSSDSDQSDTDLQTLKTKLCSGKESRHKPFSDKEFISYNVFRLPRDKAPPKSTPKKSTYIKKSDLLAAAANEAKESISDIGTDLSNTDSNSKLTKSDNGNTKPNELDEDKDNKCFDFDEEAMDSLDMKENQMKEEKYEDEDFINFNNQDQKFAVQNIENLKMVLKRGSVSNEDRRNTLTEAKEDVQENEYNKVHYDVPDHLKPDAKQFSLIVDSIDSLKQLIAKFSSEANDLEIVSRRKGQKKKPPTPHCEVMLLERLQNLLAELEPWEVELLKSARSSRDKFHKEYYSFTQRPKDFVHPNEAYWMRLYEDTPVVVTTSTTTTTTSASLSTTSLKPSVMDSTAMVMNTVQAAITDVHQISNLNIINNVDLGLRKRKRTTVIKLNENNSEDETSDEDDFDSNESDDNWEMPSTKKRRREAPTGKLVRTTPKRPTRKTRAYSPDDSCNSMDKATQSSPDKNKKALFWGQRGRNPSDDLDWETNRVKILEKHNSPVKKVLFKPDLTEKEMIELEDVIDTKPTVSGNSTAAEKRYFPIIPGNKKPYFSPAQLKAMEKKGGISPIRLISPTQKVVGQSPQQGRSSFNTQTNRFVTPRLLQSSTPRLLANRGRTASAQGLRQQRPISRPNLKNSSTQSVELIDISDSETKKEHTVTGIATLLSSPTETTIGPFTASFKDSSHNPDDLFITDGNLLVKADENFIKQFLSGERLLTLSLDQQLDLKKQIYIVKPCGDSASASTTDQKNNENVLKPGPSKPMEPINKIMTASVNNNVMLQTGQIKNVAMQKNTQNEITSNNMLLQGNKNIVMLQTGSSLPSGHTLVSHSTTPTQSTSSMSNVVVPNLNNTFTFVNSQDGSGNFENIQIIQTDPNSSENYTIIQQGSDTNPTFAIIQKPGGSGLSQQQLVKFDNTSNNTSEIILNSNSLTHANSNATSQSIMVKAASTANQTSNLVKTVQMPVRQQMSTPHNPVSTLRFIRPQNMPTTQFRNIPVATLNTLTGNRPMQIPISSSTVLQSSSTAVSQQVQPRMITNDINLRQVQPLALQPRMLTMVNSDLRMSSPSGLTVQQQGTPIRFVQTIPQARGTNIVGSQTQENKLITVQQMTSSPQQMSPLKIFPTTSSQQIQQSLSSTINQTRLLVSPSSTTGLPLTRVVSASSQAQRPTSTNPILISQTAQATRMTLPASQIIVSQASLQQSRIASQSSQISMVQSPTTSLTSQNYVPQSNSNLSSISTPQIAISQSGGQFVRMTTSSSQMGVTQTTESLMRMSTPISQAAVSQGTGQFLRMAAPSSQGVLSQSTGQIIRMNVPTSQIGMTQSTGQFLRMAAPSSQIGVSQNNGQFMRMTVPTSQIAVSQATGQLVRMTSTAASVGMSQPTGQLVRMTTAGSQVGVSQGTGQFVRMSVPTSQVGISQTTGQLIRMTTSTSQYGVNHTTGQLVRMTVPNSQIGLTQTTGQFIRMTTPTSQMGVTQSTGQLTRMVSPNPQIGVCQATGQIVRMAVSSSQVGVSQATGQYVRMATTSQISGSPVTGQVTRMTIPTSQVCVSQATGQFVRMSTSSAPVGITQVAGSLRMTAPTSGSQITVQPTRMTIPTSQIGVPQAVTPIRHLTAGQQTKIISPVQTNRMVTPGCTVRVRMPVTSLRMQAPNNVSQTIRTVSHQLRTRMQTVVQRVQMMNTQQQPKMSIGTQDITSSVTQRSAISSNQVLTPQQQIFNSPETVRFKLHQNAIRGHIRLADVKQISALHVGPAKLESGEEEEPVFITIDSEDEIKILENSDDDIKIVEEIKSESLNLNEWQYSIDAVEDGEIYVEEGTSNS